MRFLTLVVAIFAMILGLGLSVAAQQNDFLFDYRPGLTPAEVKEIDTAKASVAAFQTGLSGTLNVRVLIDEAGNISSVESVTGPGNICPSVTRSDVVAAREAASAAARLVKFFPAKVGDQPYESAGWLYFNIGPSVTAAKENEREKKYTGEAEAPPKVDAEKQPDKVRGEKYTVIGRPPDYIGQVRTQGQTTTPPNAYKIAGSGSPSQITGGVLNGKARSLPKPPYPAAARAVRASGPVTVQVLIDETGAIFSAEALSGHPLLRAASRLAACEASFTPTFLQDIPVKVSGVIVYNFVP